jgi:RNA polymerase sigma factor (TIGR02999 family)
MQDSGSGGEPAVDQLIPSVYAELRRLASHCLKRERPGHTLQATALVHEAYLKLASRGGEWGDRSKFLSVAARAMRHVLIDHARAQIRQKRGGRPQRVTLNEQIAVGRGNWSDLLDLNEALEKLAERDPRKGQVVELLFFGGLTYAECAEVLNISPVTLYRELKMAKAWLYRELAPEDRQE